MRSQLQDKTIKINCKNCIFAIYDNITQIGCQADRISKFGESVIEAYDNEKEFYILKEFCNLYRPLSWNNGNNDLNKAYDESSLNFDVFIDCNVIDEKYKNFIMDLINNVEYDKKKIRFNLFHSRNINQQTKNNVISIYKEKKNIYITICEENPQIFLHEKLISSSNNYHTIVTNTDFDSSIFNKLNTLINMDIKKCLVAHNNSNFIISNMAYKIESAKNTKNSYKDNIDNIIKQSKEINMYLDI